MAVGHGAPKSGAGGWRHRELLDDDGRLTRLAVLCAVPILLAYAVAGLVYGHLLMLTPGGFIDMPGACAWLAAVAALALACAAVHWLTVATAPVEAPDMRSVFTTHTIGGAAGQPLRLVRLRTALPPEPAGGRRYTPTLRAVLLLVAVISGLSALAGAALQSWGVESAFARPRIALAPRAEWPLWPLPQVWRWLMPLSRDDLTAILVAVGLALVLVSIRLEHRKVRGAWALTGVVAPLLVAVAHLGSAAYDFAVARGLASVHDAELMALLARDPGRHNIHTFLGLWTAIACLTTVPILGYAVGRSLRLRTAE